MLRKPLLLLTFLLFVFFVQGQTKLGYRQSLSNPSYAFPELTGWHGAFQVNAAYRNQYPGTSATMVGYATTFDAYAHKLRSGIGLNISSNRTGTGVINYNELDLNIAPKIRLKNDIVLMPAVSLQYFQQSIDFSQLNQSTTGLRDPISVPVTNNINRITAGAGLGIVFDETFIVAHSDYATRPNVSFFASENRMPRVYRFLAGRNFKLGQFLLTPNIFYQNYGKFNSYGLGTSAQYKWFYLSGQYVHNDIVAFGFGYELMERFRLSYSYDFTVSRLGTQTLGSHEFALRLWFFKDKAKTQFLKNLPLM